MRNTKENNFPFAILRQADGKFAIAEMEGIPEREGETTFEIQKIPGKVDYKTLAGAKSGMRALLRQGKQDSGRVNRMVESWLLAVDGKYLG